MRVEKKQLILTGKMEEVLQQFHDGTAGRHLGVNPGRSTQVLMAQLET